MKEEEVPKWTEKRDGDLGEVKVLDTFLIISVGDFYSDDPVEKEAYRYHAHAFCMK